MEPRRHSDRLRAPSPRTAEGTDGDIWIMNADGSDQTRLTGDDAHDFDPVFSPDGCTIALVSGRGSISQIQVMDLDGSGRRSVSGQGGVDDEPRISLDGRRILFVSDRDADPSGRNPTDLYLMSAAGREVQRLADTPARESGALFTPDGRRIVFTAATAPDEELVLGAEIFVVDADGSNLRRLTDTPEDETGIILSPDGRRILFSADLDPTAQEEDRPGNMEIFVMNFDGSGRARLTSRPGFDAAAAWR
ncbi:MAG TPA: hypothetical protein VNM66_04420 [Thermodesulfobacteriota bacterium]|nr:hypothetical protein [Thermodesulfobacteriota bacterium]